MFEKESVIYVIWRLLEVDLLVTLFAVWHPRRLFLEWSTFHVKIDENERLGLSSSTLAFGLSPSKLRIHLPNITEGWPFGIVAFQNTLAGLDLVRITPSASFLRLWRVSDYKILHSLSFLLLIHYRFHAIASILSPLMLICTCTYLSL